MQKIRKIFTAVSEKTALPSNQAKKQPTNQPTSYQQHRSCSESLTPIQKFEWWQACLHAFDFILFSRSLFLFWKNMLFNKFLLAIIVVNFVIIVINFIKLWQSRAALLFVKLWWMLLPNGLSLFDRLWIILKSFWSQLKKLKLSAMLITSKLVSLFFQGM